MSSYLCKLKRPKHFSQGSIDIEGKFEDIMTSKANYLNTLKRTHEEETNEDEEKSSLVSEN